MAGTHADTLWQVAVMVIKHRNPSTSLTLSNATFRFPSVIVCLNNGFACGFANEETDQCVESAKEFSSATIDGSTLNATVVEDRPCLSFDLSQVDVENRADKKWTRAVVEMSWVSSDNDNTDTGYRASANVFLGDNADEEEYTAVPYSRNQKTSEDPTYKATDMTIGKTHRKLLGGDSTTTFPVLTLSTTDFVKSKSSVSASSFYYSTASHFHLDPELFTDDFFRDDDHVHASSSSSPTNASLSAFEEFVADLPDEYATGTLNLVITQGAYSLTEIKDVNPLEIGKLLGSIGGFWELLVLLWGLCYIATNSYDEPTLKARDFSKIAERGSSIATRTKPKLRWARPRPGAPVHVKQHRNVNTVQVSSTNGAGQRQKSGLGSRASTFFTNVNFRWPAFYKAPKIDDAPRTSSCCTVEASSSSTECRKRVVEQGDVGITSEEFTQSEVPRGTDRFDQEGKISDA